MKVNKQTVLLTLTIVALTMTSMGLFTQKLNANNIVDMATNPTEVANESFERDLRDSSKAYCRFVPERMDDFAWENDRVAFRMYGPALWSIPKKRCSSGIDVWVKKVRYPIINKWMKDRIESGKYHKDDGEGADFYSVGKTLGCGGLGFLVDGMLHVNRHYVTQKVIQGEGDRIEFELTYAPLEINGKNITETKRISMETGSNLFKVQNSFKISGGGSVTAAIGIVLREGNDELRHGNNWVGYAEPLTPQNGQTYCGVVLDKPAEFNKSNGHAMMLVPIKDGETLTYRAGAAWSKGLDFKNTTEWMAYLQKQATSTPSPNYFSKVDLVKGETSEYFSQWPAGKSPAEIGKKVSENFHKSGHYSMLVKRGDQPATVKTFDIVIYPEICAWFGALKVARETGDNELAEKMVRRFDPYVADPTKLEDRFHVDYSVFGVVPLEIYRLTQDERCLEIGMKRADEQWSKTTPDGITEQARYWVDDIYMIAALQTAAYRVTGDPKYLERAALTTATYLKKLQKEDGLFWHAEDSPFVWGRGVGWYAAGMAEILKHLPLENPHYAPILAGYQKMMAALVPHQSESGLWRQLVDKPDSWEETSGSAMFAYAMVTGVKRGWLDEKQYGPVARKAWLALVDNLDEEGNLKNVCVGTNKGGQVVGPDLEEQYQFYLARPRFTGDYHGQAPLLWTVAALLEFKAE